MYKQSMLPILTLAVLTGCTNSNTTNQAFYSGAGIDVAGNVLIGSPTHLGARTYRAPVSGDPMVNNYSWYYGNKYYYDNGYYHNGFYGNGYYGRHFYGDKYYDYGR